MEPSQQVDVSVVVAAYNVAEYIGECLESLLACAGAGLEIIVVDDASSDATADTVSARFGAVPNVKLLRLGVNRGPSHARNAAITAATGQWIAWVDADDWCEPSRFRELLAVAHRFDADVVSDDQHVVEDGFRRPWSTINRLSRWRQRVSEPVSFERFVRSRHIVKPLIRRSFLQAHNLWFKEEVRHGEDFLLLSELLLAGARWHMSPLPMYYYRIRQGSITNTGEFAHGNLRSLERLLELDTVKNDPRYTSLCEEALRHATRRERVRQTRLALRRLDLSALRHAAAGDASVFWSILRHEAALAPLRVRRRLHRMRFG